MQRLLCRVGAPLGMLVLLTSFAGCFGESDVVKTQPPPVIDQIRTTLEDIAETGEAGSGVWDIRQQLDQLQESDSAKAEELRQDLDELESMSASSEVKSKAREMLEKL